jgi:DNA-binding NarL/FixJ family response regulator
MTRRPLPAEGADLDQAIAETLAAMRHTRGGELAALGAELVDLLDRRQAAQDTVIEDLRRTASRLDHAVRTLGAAPSRRELLRRAGVALAEVCAAERVVLSICDDDTGQAIPVAIYDAAGKLALPPDFDIAPESGEARALRSGQVGVRTDAAPELRAVFPDGCSILAVDVEATPAALLHVDTEINSAQLDSVAVCTEVLGACLRRLGLTARRSRQLELLRASARSWADDLDDTPAVDLRARTDHPAAVQVVEPLTDRENDVLRLLLTGTSNSAIATELVITVDTVKSHVKRILRKLGATNRSELIARYNSTSVPSRPTARLPPLSCPSPLPAPVGTPAASTDAPRRGTPADPALPSTAR